MNILSYFMAEERFSELLEDICQDCETKDSRMHRPYIVLQ